MLSILTLALSRLCNTQALCIQMNTQYQIINEKLKDINHSDELQNMIKEYWKENKQYCSK